MKISRHFLLLSCLVTHFAFQGPAFMGHAGEERLHALAIKDMTWVEVRAAIDAGYTTILVPTGGIEQNGPQMILGKHDYIVGKAAGLIAARLGNALVAPVVSFVPQGDYDPATGNMRFPGTIGLREPVFEMMLEDITRSLKLAGFKTILFLGDHGQSQPAQMRIAKKLSVAWSKEGVRVDHIAAYYDDRAQYALLGSRGETEASIGVHAGLIDTSELLGVHPDGVHIDRAGGEIAAKGASGQPARSSAELGRELLSMRVEAAIKEIRTLPGSR